MGNGKKEIKSNFLNFTATLMTSRLLPNDAEIAFSMLRY